ncbi:Endo-1,4-beta-D-glucanase [Penicillium ucsense]|uniref:Endoglucanase EG-II n=1 Tax=Penicillium ucsense TaxID=2839758 RepID=A0A8J8W1N6_9EURO|nr:Endo-1,4-beta-D-glucanase [Penicillium ucsense]KAF7729087.1 Endo-1,4-beta-D-glucanase [Penicillium ucsense]
MRTHHTQSLVALLSISAAAVAQQTAWGQCGGQGWTGPTSCASGYTCTYSNAYYSQCLPGSGGGGSNPTTTTTTMVRTTTTASSSGPTGGSGGKVRFAGVNIAGFDFGVKTDGTQDLTQVADESVDGVNQMQHFVNDDGFNIFRLPAGWQFLVNSNLGGSLDSNNFGKYDKLVQGCLSLGAHCIVDVHNYARWNGAVIGQGGPTDDQFLSLWTQLATKYKSESKIIFGVMNEPHDLNINTWAATVQKAVTAIRKTGATSQMILLPGTDYTNAANFIENGSGAALSAVTNPDGSTTNLIFDVHKYLDSDNSGTHVECVTDNAAAFTNLAQWLRSNKRQAMLTETGGGNVASCGQYMCQQLDVINNNSDVYLGWTSWSAGGFQPSWNYELLETPTNGVDTYLVKQCFVPKWRN